MGSGRRRRWPTVNGKPQILFATGNGLCYAFEPVDPAAKVPANRWITTALRGPIVYYIDVKGKDTAGLSPAEYAKKFPPLDSTQKPALPLEFRYSIGVPVTTPVDSIPTAQVPDVPILKKIWWFDCLPPEYRNAPFYPHGAKGDGQKHPCDIICHAGLLPQPGLRGDRWRSGSWQQEQPGKPGLHRSDQDRRRHPQRQSLELRPTQCDA